MDKEIKVYEQEVQEYQTQVSFVKESADRLAIQTHEDMVVASDLLGSVKRVKEAINERKNDITRPLMSALSSARDLFKPLEAGYAEAEKTIRAKMLTYSIKEEERIASAQAKIEGRVERGTMRQDTGIKKLEEIGDVPKSFDGSVSKTSLRTVTKVRIVDESMIPREYLVPNTVAITNAVLRDKIVIPGVETYEEKTIVSKSK